VPTAKKPKKTKAKDDKPEVMSMPSKAPAEEVADVQKTVASIPNLPVVYDKVVITERSITSPLGPLTAEDAKLMMGWETEVEYKARRVREDPSSKPEHHLFKDGEYHCLDTSGNKVMCWANANNRPFDTSWCEELIHTILYGQWAGPLTIPGGTINGETVRISLYGRTLSGQHQLTALILADEWLQKSRGEDGNAADPKYPFWNGYDHPMIETVVITGLSEDERVLRTIDYVKPRTVADMLYTMELFRENTSPERKEMTRILAAAIDFLWDRTEAKGYKTHPEVVGFLDRHRRLLKCTEHLFVENRSLPKATGDGGRKISKMHLNPGHCAAMCYLMGCSSQKTTNYSDEYRSECPPSEKNLDWSLWDKAREFWARIASDRAFIPVRVALGRLLASEADSQVNQGLGGLMPEKLAIIAAAWERWKSHHSGPGAGPPFTDEDLKKGGILYLSYNNLDDKGNVLPEGKIKLINIADFFGIDCPTSTKSGRPNQTVGPPMPKPLTKEEMEQAKEDARARRAKEAQARRGGKK
jgi:hypothetical protein